MYEKPPPFGSYYVTLSVSGWIDVFTCHTYCDILIDNLNYCVEHKNLQVYEYVLMPSYITIIGSSKKKHISTILREFKNGTARHVLKSISENPEEKRKEWIMGCFIFTVTGISMMQNIISGSSATSRLFWIVQNCSRNTYPRSYIFRLHQNW